VVILVRVRKRNEFRGTFRDMMIPRDNIHMG
jgi:hypothetical protein